MKLDVITLEGGKAAQIELSDAIFGIEEIRADILQRCVVWQLAKRRAGTHKIKTRNEVARTGKKMYKQKGTGGARHGSRKAAQFVGGAKTHGPVNRSHAIDLPKKVRALALRHALSSKAKDGSLVVVDALAVDTPKTAALKARFDKIGLKKALVIAGPDHPLRAAGDPDTPAIYLAVRNGTEARVNRSTWGQLAEIALAGGDLSVASRGTRFSLVPA